MAKKSQIIWYGIAHVKKVGFSAQKIGNAMGAETYIAIRADNAEVFRYKAIAVMRQNRFQLLSLDHIRTEFDVPKDGDNPLVEEIISLFKKLSQGGKSFAWGNFYPHGEYNFFIPPIKEE
ncbi:MAG: hypothetical protein MK207_06470 [Saprospiraceae bacterium]|nr:hypothetical protein [Saprospiraceae bacterium]